MDTSPTSRKHPRPTSPTTTVEQQVEAQEDHEPLSKRVKYDSAMAVENGLGGVVVEEVEGEQVQEGEQQEQEEVVEVEGQEYAEEGYEYEQEQEQEQDNEEEQVQGDEEVLVYSEKEPGEGEELEYYEQEEGIHDQGLVYEEDAYAHDPEAEAEAAAEEDAEMYYDEGEGEQAQLVDEEGNPVQYVIEGEDGVQYEIQVEGGEGGVYYEDQDGQVYYVDSTQVLDGAEANQEDLQEHEEYVDEEVNGEGEGEGGGEQQNGETTTDDEDHEARHDQIIDYVSRMAAEDEYDEDRRDRYEKAQVIENWSDELKADLIDDLRLVGFKKFLRKYDHISVRAFLKCFAPTIHVSFSLYFIRFSTFNSN